MSWSEDKHPHEETFVLVDDIHRLHSEWLRAVLREHGDDCIQHDICLCQVGGRALNEHIPEGRK